MNKIDLIIDALSDCAGWGYKDDEKIDKAIVAARKLKDDLYAQEMEQPTPKQSGTISITVNTRLEADIDLLWQVNSADIAALEDAKATLEELKTKAPIKYQSMIYQSLALISKALGMSHSDAFQRIIDKARSDK
jgi:chlorite dismutase